jgi:hypothetical protein
MARVRMRMLLEWDIEEPIEGAEEYMHMMEFFAEKSPLGGYTAIQTYIERNVPEEE